MATSAFRRRPRPDGWGVPIGIGIGAALGLILGSLLDQLVWGLSLGAACGLVTGSILTTATSVPPSRRRAVIGAAVGIIAAGVVASILVMVR